MELKYRTNRGDYFHFLSRQQFRSKLVIFISSALAIGLTIVAARKGTTAEAPLDPPPFGLQMFARSIVCVLFAAIIWLIITAIGLLASVLQLAFKDTGDEVTLLLEEEFFEMRGTGSSIKVEWRQIKAIEQSSRLLILQPKAGEPYFLPVRDITRDVQFFIHKHVEDSQKNGRQFTTEDKR